MSNPYSPPDQQEPAGQAASLARQARGLQIITFAMAMGVLVFMGMCLVMNEGVLGEKPELLSWIGIGFAAITFVTHLVLPGIVANATLKKLSGDNVRSADEAMKFDLVVPAFRLRHIVTCALLEGGAMLNLVAYLVTDYAGNLMAASVQLTMMLIRFPTATRLQFWAQDRIREIEMR